MITELDEAIAHAKDVAKENREIAKDIEACLECAKEHEQLAEWLAELKERREADEQNVIIQKSVHLLDLFTKTFCRYPNDYERSADLKFRCSECPFLLRNGDCQVKKFKHKYFPDYKDFGSMGDL